MTDLTPENIETFGLPRLYSPNQIGGATFLGSPIAGGVLMAQNFRALGNEELATRTNWLAIVSTAIILVLAFTLPERIPNSVVPAIYTGLAVWIAKKYQLEAFEKHVEAGGPKHSNWRVVGISIACLVAIFALIIALAFAFPQLFPA